MTSRLAPTAVVSVIAALLLAGAGDAGSAQDGGTFRIALPIGGVIAIDPALPNVPSSGQLLRPACAGLMSLPDKPLPTGLRYTPDLADGLPAISRNGKTYTFTIRKDARFSTGAPVLARDVVHSLERVLTPALQSPFAGSLEDIVGAQAMLDGKATTLSGASARGRTVVFRLRRPVGDFPARVSQCVLPAGIPVSLEGARAPLPSPAPYYVADYVPDIRVVLRRNQFYRGERSHHVAAFAAELNADAAHVVDRVRSGSAEWGWIGGAAWEPFLGDLTARYGVNKSQFYSVPSPFLRMFVLNTSRPLFRNNAQLRQAVNFAVDRRALIREFGPAAGTPTDQYLPPIFPGFRDEKIYPLEGPDLRQARRLAAGRTRSGKAVLYTCSGPTCIGQAQILQRNLAAIGLDLEIATFPPGVLFDKLENEPESFDIGWVGWGLDSASGIGGLFDGRTLGRLGNVNFSHFDSPTYNALITAAEAVRFGPARERAYGDLDVRLSRDAAPGIPYGVTNALTFVSAKVGCIVLNPFLDLTAVCLK